MAELAPMPPALRDWGPELAALAGWIPVEDLDDAMREHVDKLERRGVISAEEASAILSAFDL